MSEAERLRRWQRATLALLVVGYAAYYLCRSNFSVALPLIAAELADSGMPREVAQLRLGGIASLGVLAYALGKFASGAITVAVGGRRSFLAGMGLSALCTLAFAASGSLPFFTLAWTANRLVQSAGWVGAVQVTSRWFGAASYGTAMGVISTSFLIGDAVARAAMGILLSRGWGWRALFVAAAVVLLGVCAVCTWLLRESPRERALAEPDGEPGTSAAATRAGLELASLLGRRSFQLVCAVSLGLTLLRETFNTWTPTYFRDAVGLAPGDAASASALFPLFGCASVLLAGWLSDRLGPGGRAGLLLAGITLAIGSLLALARIDAASQRLLAVALVATTGFLLIGPYSFLAGAISLDFGGKRGGATAAGIIDGVGYLGGVLAGGGVARAAVEFGWTGAFLGLAGVATATALCALLFARERRRSDSPGRF